MRLIDADALRESLFESSQFDTYNDYSMVLDTIDLASTIEAEPARQWISVEDRLPKKGEARKRVTEHHIKIQKEFADAVMSGEKTFEILMNDWGYQKGDLIRFQVVDGNFPITLHSLNDKTYEITYVLSGWGLCEGYVVFAIKEKTDAEIH